MNIEENINDSFLSNDSKGCKKRSYSKRSPFANTNTRRETVDPADLSALIQDLDNSNKSFNSSVNSSINPDSNNSATSSQETFEKSTSYSILNKNESNQEMESNFSYGDINNNRRETVDANELQEIIMSLEDSSSNLSVSVNSKSTGKNTSSRISNASSVATPDASQLSIANKSNHRLSTSTIATEKTQMSLNKSSISSNTPDNSQLSIVNKSNRRLSTSTIATEESKRSQKSKMNNSVLINKESLDFSVDSKSSNKSMIHGDSVNSIRKSSRLSQSSNGSNVNKSTPSVNIDMDVINDSGIVDESTKDSRRETVDANDLQEMMMFLEDSSSIDGDISVSVNSKSTGKNKSNRISNASSVATPDASHLSIVNKSNHRLSTSTIATEKTQMSLDKSSISSNTPDDSQLSIVNKSNRRLSTSTIATEKTKNSLNKSSNNSRLTVDSTEMREIVLSLDNSTLSVDVSASGDSKRSRRNKSISSKKTTTPEESIASSRRSSRLSLSSVGADMSIDSNVNERRETVDAADINKLINELDDSSVFKEADSSTYVNIPTTNNTTISEDGNNLSVSALETSGDSKRSRRKKSISSKKTTTPDESIASTRRSSRLSLSSVGADIDSNINGRRETVDAADINKLITDLDDSSVYKEADSSTNVTIPITNNTTISEDGNNLSVSALETSNQSKGKKSRSSAQTRRSSIESISLSFCNSELSKNSSISDLNSPQVRRETVDPTDMANLMKDLINDSSLSENTSNAKNPRHRGGPRDSIDTVDLQDSIAGILNSLDKDNENNDSILKDNVGRGRRDTANESEIHQLVSELNGTGSKSTNGKHQGRDDSTVCMDENFLENSFDSQENSIITVATIDVMQSINDVLLPVDEDPDDVTSGSLVSLARLLENVSQRQDEKIIVPSPVAPKVPNSILKSAKKNKEANSSVKFDENMNSIRKSVVFGSPEAASFNKFSPTTSFTPLNKEEVQSYFPQDKDEFHEEIVDEITDENSRILEEWDRLTNTSECSSPDEVILEDSESMAFEVSSNRSSSSRGSRRRQSKVQPIIPDYDNNGDISNQSGMDTSSFGNYSKTVNLPDTLADLIIENTRPDPTANISFHSTSDQTEEIEMDLGALIKRLDGKSDDKSVSQSESNDSHGSSQIFSFVTDRCGASILSANSDADTLGPLIGIDNNNFEFSNRFSGEFNTSVEISNTNDNELSGAMDISIDENDYTHKLEDNLCDLVNCIAANNNVSPTIVTKPIDAEISVILNSCDDENRNSSEDIDCDISTATTVLEVDLSRKSISNNQSAAKPSGTTVYSPFTHQPVITAGPSSTLSTNTLINKIRSLNAGARTNALSQCSTPVVPSGRMSIGIKRLSMMTSGKKPTTTTTTTTTVNEKPKTTVPIVAAETELSQVDKENIPSSQNSIVPSTEPYEKLLSSVTKPTIRNVINPNASMDNTEYEFALRNIANSYFMFVQQTRLSTSNYSTPLKNIVGTAIKGSLHKVLPDSFLESINQFQNGLFAFDNLWTMESLEVCNILPSIEDYVQCYSVPNAILENLSITANTNISKLLLDVSSLAILEKTEAMRIQNNIDSTVIDPNEQEKPLDGQEKFFRKALNTPIPQRRRSLDRKQSNFSELNQAYSSLQQLNLQVEVINKLSHCRVKTFRSDLLRIDSYLSPLVIISINFHIKKSESDSNNQQQLIITNTEVDLDMQQDPTCQQIESKIASAYFASIICGDDVNGPLSPSSLSTIESPSQIPELLRQLCGAICQLRKSLVTVSAYLKEGSELSTINKDNSWNIQIVNNNNNEVKEVPIRSFIANIY